MYLNSLAQIPKLKGKKRKKRNCTLFQLKKVYNCRSLFVNLLCLECLLDTLGQDTCSMMINFIT